MTRTILISSMLALTCFCFTGCGGGSSEETEDVQVDEANQAKIDARKDNPVKAPGVGSTTGGTMSGSRGD